MATIEQIRAARALLDWSQSDLADHAGLSQTGIARIENGTNKPNSQTLNKIMTAFANANIEFIGTSGVRKKTSEIKTLEGIEGFKTFLDTVYQTARDVGGEICVFNSHHENFYKWSGGKEWYEAHAKRMISVASNFKMKVVIAEDDYEFIGSGFAEYRWFPKDQWSDQTIYSYGEYLTFLNFDENNVKIMILQNAQFTEGFKVLFNTAWNEVAKVPTKK